MSFLILDVLWKCALCWKIGLLAFGYGRRVWPVRVVKMGCGWLQVSDDGVCLVAMVETDSCFGNRSTIFFCLLPESPLDCLHYWSALPSLPLPSLTLFWASLSLLLYTWQSLPLSFVSWTSFFSKFSLTYPFAYSLVSANPSSAALQRCVKCNFTHLWSALRPFEAPLLRGRNRWLLEASVIEKLGPDFLGDLPLDLSRWLALVGIPATLVAVQRFNKSTTVQPLYKGRSE